MNQWECEECGAVAETTQRKECIQGRCDERCKWAKTSQVDQTDNDSEDEE